MIWSEYEAYVLQVTQIDASACGATAVINILVSRVVIPIDWFLDTKAINLVVLKV